MQWRSCCCSIRSPRTRPSFFCQKIRTQLQNETDITLILIQRLKTKDLILDRVHRYFNPKQLCSAICKTQSFFMGSKPINKMYNDSVLNEWKSWKNFTCVLKLEPFYKVTKFLCYLNFVTDIWETQVIFKKSVQWNRLVLFSGTDRHYKEQVFQSNYEKKFMTTVNTCIKNWKKKKKKVN